MDGKDQHFCIVCRQTIWGLENYVNHRKFLCEKETGESSADVGPLDESSNNCEINADPNLNATVAGEAIVKYEEDRMETVGDDANLKLTEPSEQIEKGVHEITDIKLPIVDLEENNDLSLTTVSQDEDDQDSIEDVKQVVDRKHFMEETDGDSEDDFDTTNDNPLIDLKTFSSGQHSGNEDSLEYGILSARQNEVVNNEGLKEKYKHFNLETGTYDCTVCEKSFKAESLFQRHCSTQTHKERFNKSIRLKMNEKRRKQKDVTEGCINNMVKLEDTEVETKETVLEIVNICTVCDRKFASLVEMMQHLVSVSHKTETETNSLEKEHIDMMIKYQKEIIQSSPFCCKACKFYCNTNEALEQHVRSGLHLKTFGGSQNRTFECTLCNVRAKGQNRLLSHLQSYMHLKEIKKKEKVMVLLLVQETTLRKLKTYYFCSPCKVQFTNQQLMRRHIRSREHNRRLTLENEHKSQKRDIKAEVSVQDLNIKVGESLSESASDVVENESLDDGTFLNDIQVSPNAEDGINFEEVTVAGGRKKKTVCKYCAFCAENSSELRLHYMKVHREMIKVCEPCDLIFPHGKGYNRHILSKEHQRNVAVAGENNPEGMFECHVCKKKFADGNYCKFHTAYYHFHAKTEEEVFDEKSVTRQKYADFLKTLEVAKNMDTLDCPESGCGAHIMKVNMLGHLRKHTNEKPFRCNICVETFLNASSLRRHLLTHFGCDERKCELCGKEFNTMSTYNHHMRLHKAEKSESKSFTCYVCGESFYLIRQLKAHQKNHMERTHKCPIPGCTWAFKTPHAVKRHLVTHSDSKHYVCTTCGYATKSMKYLLSHEKIHSESEQRLIHCKYCEYKTANKYHMTRHNRIHLGVKPFKCPYCTYTCNTHANLRKHILETNYHKGLNMYPCKLCNYSTNCTKEFRVHLLEKHKDVENNNRSFAAFIGLFNKNEDIEGPGSVIMPLRGKASTRRKYKDEAVADESFVTKEESPVKIQFVIEDSKTLIDFDNSVKMDIELISEENC